jgi:hypothetical protein
MILTILKWRLVSCGDWFQYVADFFPYEDKPFHADRTQTATTDIDVSHRARSY